ncbi:MAG: iron-containing alcohol dehydrogenase, partial [Kiritimatiellaeota bacterium]|nr:iron-containing alcohol dehydrogenase [Kiritimatiellota bacterium]
ATHMIGHELTAFYGPDHAETLAVVMPGVWKYKLEAKRVKLKQYGRRVWGVKSAAAAIAKTEQFFLSLGMPVRLSAYKINANEAAEKIATRFAARGDAFGEHGDINAAAAAAILRKRA